jgi:hypothetical protein
MSQYESSLNKYLDIFISQEMYFVSDIQTLEAFKLNPKNTDKDTIRMKLSSINDIELRLKSSPEDMIEHILKLDVDNRLEQGDLSLVDEMAGLEGEDKKPMLLRFASAYCNFHRPETFPIYSEQHFDFYRNYIRNYKLPLDPAKLNTYAVFCLALKDLIERLGLTGKLNYLHIRKFGWLYAEKVVSESKSEMLQ